MVELVSAHVRLKRSGRRWVGLCPFHSEKTPSFTVRPEHGSFKCFGCGKGGDAFTFVQLRENVSFMEAMTILADRVGVTIERSASEKQTGVSRADIARVNQWALEFFQNKLNDPTIGREARDYLARRGFSDSVVQAFSLGLAVGNDLRPAASRAGFDVNLLVEADLVRNSDRGDTYDTFRDRLVFPIRDATSRVIGFGGRTLVDDRAKYLNTRQTALFDKGRNLFGIDQARESITQSGRAVLVEGYTDCVAAHQAGFCATVATLGTALTESQVELLRRYGDEVILLFDSDDAGVAAADRAIRVALPRCVRVRMAKISDGKDPGEFLESNDAEAFSDVLSSAVDALEFKWLQTRTRFDADESDAKRRDAVRDFLTLLAEVAATQAVDAIQRGLLVNQVAHLLRMDRSDVDRLLRDLAPRTARGQSNDSAGESVLQSPPSDAEQAGWRTLLEVLLNQPSLLLSDDDLPDHTRICEPACRRIAEVLVKGCSAPTAMEFNDVLAQLTEPGDAALATELAARGAQRGNYQQTYSLAREKIRQAVRIEEVEEKRRRLVSAPLDESQPQRDDLASLGEGMRQHRRFAPRRLIRQSTGPSN